MEQLPRSKGCFVCGSPEENRRSLGVDIFWNDDEKQTEITIAPDATWCGYEGIVHGGIIASVFDDAMGWAVRKEIDSWAVTGEMTVRYLRPVQAGRSYSVSGRAEKLTGRRVSAVASMTDEGGKKVAEARGIFVRIAEKEGDA